MECCRTTALIKHLLASSTDGVVCGTNVEAEFDDLLDVAPNENDESPFGAS